MSKVQTIRSSFLGLHIGGPDLLLWSTSLSFVAELTDPTLTDFLLAAFRTSLYAVFCLNDTSGCVVFEHPIVVADNQLLLVCRNLCLSLPCLLGKPCVCLMVGCPNPESALEPYLLMDAIAA